MTTAAPPVVVPSPVRRPVAVLVTVAAATFAVLAVRYAGTSSAGGVDVRVDAVVDALGHQWLVRHVTALGSPPLVAALACALAVVCLLLGRRRLALLAVIGPGLTGLATTICKPLLGRTIDGGLAFPSGHTGGATSLGLIMALLLISLLRPGRGGALAILAAGGLVVGGGVGAAMVASNVHYPTDTLGGFCTAVVMVCGSALLLDRLPSRQPPRHAA
jgi:membrane-associated phospholipid phosphatase